MSLRKAQNEIRIFGADGFQGMRASGRLAAETLDFITPHVLPGVTTGHLDALCETFIRDHGAIPAPLGYRGYPKATCISINHVVCHGIPGDRPLLNGDIVNIDITTILDGWYGDTSRMFLVGDAISIKARRLVSATYEAMMRGIAACRPGATTGDIGAAIEDYIHKERFSIVEDFCGHGLGREFHTPPNILHFGRRGTGTLLRPGMFFTIEPMINAGRKDVMTLSDGWTAVTRDKSLSAQFEHSIGITETGCEIFTLSPSGFTQPPYKTSA